MKRPVQESAVGANVVALAAASLEGIHGGWVQAAAAAGATAGSFIPAGTIPGIGSSDDGDEQVQLDDALAPGGAFEALEDMFESKPQRTDGSDPRYAG